MPAAFHRYLLCLPLDVLWRSHYSQWHYTQVKSSRVWLTNSIQNTIHSLVNSHMSMPIARWSIFTFLRQKELRPAPWVNSRTNLAIPGWLGHLVPTRNRPGARTLQTDDRQTSHHYIYVAASALGQTGAVYYLRQSRLPLYILIKFHDFSRHLQQKTNKCTTFVNTYCNFFNKMH